MAVISKKVSILAKLKDLKAKGKDSMGSLTTHLAQFLGGKNSPSLIRLPVTEEGELDIASMVGTVLDPTCKYLVYKDQCVPAPMYMRSYKLLELFTLKKDNTEVSLGFYVDVDAWVVRLDTIVRKDIYDLSSVKELALISYQHLLDKEILHHHEGWVTTAQYHFRHDLKEGQVSITEEMVPFIAKMTCTSEDKVHGMQLDIRRYPLVENSALQFVTVLVEEGAGRQRKLGSNDVTTKIQLGDYDGDVANIGNIILCREIREN